MTERMIASDAPLTAEQRDTLGALLETIVPASDDGRMPSARELDFAGHLQGNGSDLLPELGGILERFDADFSTRSLPERYQQVKAFSEQAPDLFERLLAQVYGCYYQDQRVLQEIGLDGGAPFPRGNRVQPGDLSLLDPVLNSRRNWRRRVP